MALKWPICKSADISRAYPKARKYLEKDYKWVEWPTNGIKDPERAAAIGFKAGTILKCLRPLYGTVEAGKDFCSSFTYDLTTVVGLQNSMASPCLFASVPNP